MGAMSLMTHFHWTYCSTTQCLIKSDSKGKELQRIFIPVSDLSKVCAIIWEQTVEKDFLEKE